MGKSTKGGGASDKKGKGKEKEKAGDSSRGEAADKGKGLKPASSINVRHILCEKFSKKEEALEKLRNGSKFDDIAREYSEDKARQGGSLGWKKKGDLDPTFEKAAYDLEPSTTNSPKYAEVKTGFGYHIIMIEGRK
ncbi:hypothetical protein BDW62DRAFT_171578 [Aspergillus aurantiobrunneus]